MKQPKNSDDAIRILRITEVSRTLGRSRSGIYDMLNAASAGYDPTFPPPIRLSLRTVGWRYQDILDWLDSRPRCGAQKREAA